jgi:hypothetical protein
VGGQGRGRGEVGEGTHPLTELWGRVRGSPTAGVLQHFLFAELLIESNLHQFVVVHCVEHGDPVAGSALPFRCSLPQSMRMQNEIYILFEPKYKNAPVNQPYFE